MRSRLTVVLVSLLLASPAVIFWLWLVILRATMAILCPDECRCDPGGYYVNCSDTSLTSIPLIFPTDFRELVLYGNNITFLEKDSFISRGLTELDKLTMFNCQLETIEVGAFNGLTQLTHLSMSFNHISEIISRTFENMSRLQILGLPYNRIQYLESDAFCGMFNLKQIYLDGNKLQYVHPDVLVELSSLKSVYMSNNPVLKIPTDRHFINSHSLSRLDISDCNVNSVSVETFANVSALEWLDLRYNNLSSVDINILKVLPKLSTLYLYGNRLQCDCQLQEVWRWCQDHNIQTASGETAPECDTPSEVKGIWWGVLEKGQCLQDNIYYYRDYENTSYRYNPAEDMDTYTDTDTDMLMSRSNFLTYVIPLVYAVAYIFGITGNAILLIIITCNKDMRTVPNMYILNLAISDMIYLMVRFVESCAIRISDTWLQSDITCKFFVLFLRLSAYSVAVLSIQRYSVTVNPFHVRVSSQQTWPVTVATICGVWIVAALFALPSALSGCLHLTCLVESCHIYYKRIILFELLVSTVLPVCVIAFSYIMTARHLVKSAQPISEGTQIPQLKTRNITARIVVGLTVVFLISYVPNHVLWTYVMFNIFPISVENFVDPLRYTIIVSAYLLLLNPCLNPVALFCTSRAFRRHFKRYLTCCCKANPTASNIELTRRN